MKKQIESKDWAKFERAVDVLVRTPPKPRKKEDGKASYRRSQPTKSAGGRGTDGGSKLVG